jgi:hypothetical protein
VQQPAAAAEYDAAKPPLAVCLNHGAWRQDVRR